MKRLLDIFLSAIGLILASPIMVPVMIAIWLQDFKSPFYISDRVGKNQKLFKMYKLRSMVVGADKKGASSTTANDARITAVGHLIRKLKLDELSQLINVFIGDMSIVGPRPNVIKNGVELYTQEEMRLLSVEPGITDISSIVFFNEGEILQNSSDPDGDYNKLIRPWKSRLGLLYIDKQSIFLDLELIYLTALAIISKERALQGVEKILHRLNADPLLIEVSKRKSQLYPYPPPGLS